MTEPTKVVVNAEERRLDARARRGLALCAVSLAFLVVLAATHAPLADVWLTAIPFALMGWLGFATSLAGVVVGAGRPRSLALAITLVWIALWLLTFSNEAQDLVAAVRRATFAYIAF